MLPAMIANQHQSKTVNLKVLLPFKVFVEASDVTRIVAETSQGSMGLLPQRLDFVTALVPGILVYGTSSAIDVCLAIDEGVLVKAGDEVLVSVRNAVGGADLDSLHTAVEQQFLQMTEQEAGMRSVMAKLEAGFMHRFVALHD